MNYLKIYDNLIDRARHRVLTGYYERHHVIPRCLGGPDDPTNIVNLTPEEHYLAHQILVKIYPKNLKIIHAAIIMSTHDTERRIGNKNYGWLRRKASEARKAMYKADPDHPIHKGLFVGKTHSQESKDRISLNTSKALKAKFAKDIFCFNLDGTLVATFTNLTDAADSVGSCASNIKYCAEGRISQVKGFYWSYVNTPPTPKERLYLRNRKVHTDDGIFDSVKDVMTHFGFKSTTAVRRRCLSPEPIYNNWYYLDSTE